MRARGYCDTHYRYHYRPRKTPRRRYKVKPGERLVFTAEQRRLMNEWQRARREGRQPTRAQTDARNWYKILWRAAHRGHYVEWAYEGHRPHYAPKVNRYKPKAEAILDAEGIHDERRDELALLIAEQMADAGTRTIGDRRRFDVHELPDHCGELAVFDRDDDRWAWEAARGTA